MPCVSTCAQAAGCHLTALGWCCFGTLCCVALPLSWLPFVCAFCKPQVQRPVYAYPIDCLTVSFITAAADDAWSTQKAASTATSAPSIHCMDASMLEPTVETQDQLQQRRRQQQQDASAQLLRVRCTPSPPPMSIFIPPSAVPACESLSSSQHSTPCAGHSRQLHTRHVLAGCTVWLTHRAACALVLICMLASFSVRQETNNNSTGHSNNHCMTRRAVPITPNTMHSGACVIRDKQCVWCVIECGAPWLLRPRAVPCVLACRLSGNLALDTKWVATGQ